MSEEAMGVAYCDDAKNVIIKQAERIAELEGLCEKAYMRLYGSYGAEGAEFTLQEKAMQDASMILDEALGNKYTGQSESCDKPTEGYDPKLANS